MEVKEVVREESWGKIYYRFDTDEFRAEVQQTGVEPLPSFPIGVGWIIIGGCNLKCIHCYGNLEALPRIVMSTDNCMTIVDRIIEAKVMRVVISGGEPLLRDDIFSIIKKFHRNGVSIVLGTNGSFIQPTNVRNLKLCTRVEVSLDAMNPELNNRIRPSRQKRGNAWDETMNAIKLCLDAGINLRILTTLNVWNQHQILGMANVLDFCGVNDWGISWTIPAGRALPIYSQLRPQEETVEPNLAEVRRLYPNIRIRYSNRATTGFSRFYCLILPDGQMSTEDMEQGKKMSFGSLLEQPIAVAWNGENYNLHQHFAKWVGDRVTFI